MKIIQRHGLWVVLALALAVRLAPMLFEHQMGQDIAEYENIAQNIRAGRGPVLDIEGYWTWQAPRPGGVRFGDFQVFNPTRHYAFYERPLLLPILLAVGRLVLPPLAASQAIGPLLYLLTLALIYQTLRREAGPGTAFSAGLLLALQPSLFQLSLMPLSENTVLLALALIIWAHFRMRSPLLTGMACSLAFLARPSTILVAMLMGLVYLVESIRTRQWLRVVQFTIMALIVPCWVAALNRAMGAAPTTLPVSFLFHVVSFEDGLHYLHQGRLYASALELIRENRHEVLRRLALNVFYYFKGAVSADELGLLLVLLPVAAAGLWQSQARQLRRFRLLALFALCDVGLYLVTWSTLDPWRFMCVTIMLGVILIMVGSHEVLDREPLFRRLGAWQSAASWGALMVALVWLGQDAAKSYLALREWQLGRPLSNNLEEAWSDPGIDGLMRQLNLWNQGQTDAAMLQVVASNDPWLVNKRTHMAAGMIPYDLKGAEWTAFLDAMHAKLVVLHEGEWPAAWLGGLQDLERQLTLDGWRPWYSAGQITSWWKRAATPPAAAGAM